MTTVPPSRFVPGLAPLQINDRLLDGAARRAIKQKRWLLLFVVGTKPCFYKFWGPIRAAEAEGLPYVVVNTGQHYDAVLTFGLEEFGLGPRTAARFNIRGDLAQKSAELFLKMRWLSNRLYERHPGLVAAPVVLGDTLMTSVVPAAWFFARATKSIQLEAGLRSMAPLALREMAAGRRMPLDRFFERQQRGPWERLTTEPFPEQYDTFTSAAGCEFLFAPLGINRDHLIAEGHPADSIWLTGGVGMEALAHKRGRPPRKSVFSVYPRLARGRWIRVDIHRKENLTRRRFEAIVGGVAALVDRGHNVNFVEMNVTRAALDASGLRRELERLKGRPNFLMTPVWPEYAQVIEFYRSPHCLAAYTDSGGLQEELNALKKPCLTCRFNTDRPETVNDGRTNLLIPPISAAFVAAAVSHVAGSERWLNALRGGRALYGASAGPRFARAAASLMKKHARPFRWAHERLGFWSEPAAAERP